MAASADDPGPADAAPPDRRIQELVEDAWLYATYGRYAGSFRDGRLFEAVAEAIRERPPSDRLVVELQNALNQTARDIPYETVAALKGGWSPGRTGSFTKVVTFVLVIASIMLMMSVAKLTFVHNRGTELVAELSDVVADSPGTALQLKIEDHARDRLELERQPNDDANGFLGEYIQASLLSRQREEIKALSSTVTRLSGEVGRYLSQDSLFPLTGMQTSYCLAGRAIGLESPFFGTYCPEAPPATSASGASDTTASPPQAVAPAPRAAAARAPASPPQTCDSIDYYGFDELAEAATALDKWSLLFDRETRVMLCAQTLAYNPSTQTFALTPQLNDLKRRVGYYALWILPALYGAMGAVMYHMRWVLDPLLPHPSLLRLLHRIVLGALAGIVLGWFYSPGTAISDAADRVGFSLFVVAFFFGFSLDIFFALLDRLVTRSERSIRGALGSDRDSALLAALRTRRPEDAAAEEPTPRQPQPPPAATSRAEPSPVEPVTFSRSAAGPT